MCKECEREEIRLASACWEAEKEAMARGEDFQCTCPRVECTHETKGE